MAKEVNSDYQLWKKIKAGKTKAFHELYVLYADVLFSFGMIFTKDEELVKDCIHDLIFDLYKYRKNLSDNDNIRNYLFKALKRKIIEKGKRKLSLVYSGNLQANEEYSADMADLGLTDEESINLNRIIKLIGELPDKQQEILNLRFQLDLTYTEIANLLEISIESARTSVYRSVKTIRKELSKTGATFLYLFIKDKCLKAKKW